MKARIPLSFLLASAGSLLAQTNVTIHSEDFETGGTNFTDGNANVTFSIGADPEPSGAQGMVGAADLGIVLARWGAITSSPDNITLPLGVEPGTSTFTASMRVFYPTDTTSIPGDRTGFILRWNGVVDQSSNLYFTRDDIPADTWTDLILNETIPALDANGVAVTSVTIILSFDDMEDDAAAGTAVYIDDFQLQATVSADDPNFPNPPEFGFGDIEQNGGPITKELLLTNSGTTNTLTITAADFSGPNTDLFSLSALTLPLDIAPGESESLTVTLDPGAELGFLSASLDFISNDSSTPMATTLLSATSVEAFAGVEFIVNGGFETGNLDGWRQDDQRFNFSNAQARTGTGSAVYTMIAGQQWGEARTSINDPDPLESIPITEDLYGRDFFYSAWFYRPSTGAPAENDTFQTIFRWNGINSAGSSISDGTKTVGSIPTDTWVRFTLSGQIPFTDVDGAPLTHVVPLWSFRDVNSDSLGGEMMFIDDVSFRVDAPVLEPVLDLVITNLLVDKETNNVSFTFPATIGTEYAIERSTRLQPNGEPGGWIEIDDPTATSTLETFTDVGAAATSPLFFYRVRRL